MRRACLNEDCNHFYCSHPASDMTAEGADRLVDTYARSSGLGALFFNINVKRALYDSKVWEPIYEGYDPNGPDDQPALRWLAPLPGGGARGRLWPHQVWLLTERKADHVARWLARSRKHGAEAWLSVRMNDWHYNHEPDSYWHGSLWRTRPDLYRRGYRNEWWHDLLFDYGKAEVREHHLNLIRELFERFDADGVELDWIRNPQLFRPGFEEAGLPLLNGFMREVRALADRAAKARGRAVRVGVRVPEEPETARRLGMDAAAWMREGWTDHVTLSPFLGTCPFDPPLELWRDLAGGRPVTFGLTLNPTVSPFHSASIRKGTLPAEPELLRGAAAAGYFRGAERVTLFNFCYWETPDGKRLGELIALMDDLGDREAVYRKARRHAVSYNEVTAPGVAEDSLLPASFLHGAGSASKYGNNTISLTLPIGPAPEAARASRVILGFAKDRDLPGGAGELHVRVNGCLCPAAEAVPGGHSLPALVGPAWAFPVPGGALHDGRNAVEIYSDVNKGELVWAEIAIESKL
jgi:hypothetical protein